MHANTNDPIPTDSASTLPAPNQHQEALRRAILPEVCAAEDVAVALRVRVSAARKRMLSGDCGPCCRMGRRLVILREDFLAAIRARSAGNVPPPPGPAAPRRDERLLAALSRTRGRRP